MKQIAEPSTDRSNEIFAQRRRIEGRSFPEGNSYQDDEEGYCVGKKREGCTEGQGYLFGKPQPVKSVVALLARQDSKAVA